MNAFERGVRAAVYASFRDRSAPPSVEDLAGSLGASQARVAAALHALADEHCLVLTPGAESVWMAHPFSGICTDFVVTIGARRWFANCAWDGLSILALLGDGVLITHSPATGSELHFEVRDGVVSGDGVLHFLVPARSFWTDIGYT